MKLGGVGDQAVGADRVAADRARARDAVRGVPAPGGRDVRVPRRDRARSSRGASRRSAGHWYVVGFDRVRDAVRAFRADRIDGDVEVGEPDAFEVPADFRADDHIEDRAWLLGDAPPVTVRARGRRRPPRRRARRARRRRARRAEPATDGDAVVEVTVTNRAAFRSFVLGFLEHAEVLEPPDVRADMIDWLERPSRPERA